MLCKSCGASFPPKVDRCPYCGAGRPPAPIGDVGKTGSVCPTCHSALVKVPEKRDYFMTVTRYTQRAEEIRAEHIAAHEKRVRDYREAHSGWGCGCSVVALGLFLMWVGGGASFLSQVGVYCLLGGAAYALCKYAYTELTLPKQPPFPDRAEETEEVQELERTHSGMMLKCLSCGWEDWEFNYNEGAQAAARAAKAAKKQARAAERAAEAAERQAQAARDQANAQEQMLWEQRRRDD